ncbi:MAG: hypothetical protein HKN51_11570, partial [Saprospiraceae bacterium]|nr:hypothetical protein [Saprospiraceae bacterium]
MKNVFNQLQLLLFIISLSVIFTVTLLAEGTRELAPNANIVIDGNNTNDIAALHIDNAVFNNFASFGNSNVNSRLHVHIADPLTEGIMLGFSGGHTNQTGGNPPQVNFEYQILDPAGNIVFGPILVTNTNARINNWSEAFNGPMQLNGTSGYDAMEVTAADLTSAGWTTEGDYYIEFRNLMGGAFLIDYWDITVADFSSTTVEEKKGRVWSFNWAFFAINDFGFPERPFNGSFYVCAPDPQNLDAAFITEIDFNGSGFRPAAFNIAFNSFGTLNTSNIVADRRSQENVNSTTPEYAIFLNDPVDICETAESGEIEVLGITRCGIDDFCIKFIGTRSGQIDLLLDFDGNDQVFTPGTADVMITGSVSAGDVGQAVCLDWNGLDGLGNALPEDANTPIPISLSFAQGIYHFPIYDAELMTDGFDINTVRPAGPKPLLYYDDTEISVSSGSGEPNVQLMGCNLPCHSWTNYSNPGTVGFGNLNTINSWWFSQQTMNTMTFFLPGVFTCDIEGPQVACEDEEVDLGIIIDLTPDNAMPLTIESINWTGPGILGGNGTEVITINENGTYNADLSFINELGDTCTSSCQFEYAQLPKSEETIDTLLAFGDSLVVNTEIYDVDGTYTQILTAANGCDSILTIIVEVEMPEIELRCEIFGPEFLCAGDTTTLTLDIIKDPIDAPDPEILSIGWFGPGVPIGASGQSVVAEQAGVYIAEYIWVNFTNDTLKGACEYTLEVMPEFEVTIDTLINSGDVVIFNGESFDSAGIFTQELSTTMGCDSIIIITIDVIDPTYTCLLTGTPEICEGEVSIIELEAVVDPIGAPAPIISEIVWSGPGVAANTTGTTIDATESGIYTAELSWFNNADSILSTSCIYSLTVNPTFETTIDTLIGEDEIIAISGQIITSPGQYILNFNAQNGCDSLLIINVIQESSVVYYDLDDCRSTDYSRFDPDYPSPVDCAFMTASNVFRVNPNVNSHSCTPGVNGGVGLCVSSEDDCDYNPDSEKAIIFELVVSPDEEEAVQITSLRFFERAPETFQWIVGTTGLNNYPTQYGLRVLKNNQEIFSSADNVTTTDWTAETFNFATLPDFKVQEQTIFRFELLGYCLIGNDSDVTAWDVDEISIQADCAEFVSNTIDIVGQVKTISNEPLENVQVDLKFGEFDFQKFVDQTNEAGQYAFQDVPRFQDYMVKPVSGDDYLRGVSTLDLIHIQRHILGLDRFEYA